MAITTKSLPSHPSPRYPTKVPIDVDHMIIKSLKVWEVLSLGWRLSSVREIERGGWLESELEWLESELRIE